MVGVITTVDLKALAERVANSATVREEASADGKSVVTAGRVAKKKSELSSLPEDMPLFRVYWDAKKQKFFKSTLALFRSDLPGDDKRLRLYDAELNVLDIPYEAISYEFGRGYAGSATIKAWNILLVVHVGLGEQNKTPISATGAISGANLNKVAMRPHPCQSLSGLAEGSVLEVIEVTGMPESGKPYYQARIAGELVEIASTETLEAYLKAAGGQLPITVVIDFIETKMERAKGKKEPQEIKIVHFRAPDEESLDDLNLCIRGSGLKDDSCD